MEFNLGMCDVLPFRRSNVKERDTVNGRTLNSRDVQKDLGAQVRSSLKVATQVDRVVKNEYGMLAFIVQEIEYRSQDVISELFKAFGQVT
eukprot:g17743.t1